MGEPASDDRGKALHFVALSRFSDACEPGTLTPECPFYVVTEGGPACGEECLDMLAEHGGRHGSVTGIDLGRDLTAYSRGPRARVRRGPEPEQKPFDAAEATLSEAHLPAGQRSTTALLGGLREAVGTPPWTIDDPDSRISQIEESLLALAHRGLDREVVVREGFGPAIMGGLTLSLVLNDMLEGRPVEEHGANFAGAPPEDWLLLLIGSDALALTGPARATRVLEEVDRIVCWVESAPIYDLLIMEAPAELPPRGVQVGLDRSVGGWIVDRFCETYVADWGRDSLVLEWGYINSQHVGCCPPEVMRERRMDHAEIATAMADLATAEWSHERATPAPHRVEVERFTRVAIEQLQAGNRSSALAIYESLVHVAPGSATAQNNYGFCLIPDDPAKALTHLEKASSLGFDDPVNVANQVLCHVRLENWLSAKTIGEALLPELDPLERGFLWLVDSGDLRFDGPLSVAEYVEGLLELVDSQTSVDLREIETSQEADPLA